tara:strand:+ start:552 stop:914 length:363 start_codon:yes stop_codon:yes gene_type:complete
MHKREKILLSITELKAEKVEFNLGDDLEKLADKFRKLANEETASTKKIFNVESELSEIAKGMEDTVQKGISIYSKLEKSAKELGVNVNKIPSVEKAARLLAGADIVKRIKSNLSKLNGIK